MDDSMKGMKGKSGYPGKDLMRERAEKLMKDSGFEGGKSKKMPKTQTDMHIPKKKASRCFGLGGIVDSIISPLTNRFVMRNAMKKGGKVTKKADGGKMAMGGETMCKKRGGKMNSNSEISLSKRTHAPMNGEHPKKAVKKAMGGAMPMPGGSSFVSPGRIPENRMASAPMYKKGGAMKKSGSKIMKKAMGGDMGSNAEISLSKRTMAPMNGEKPVRLAAGGVGKIRHGQATKSGKPISRRSNRNK